MPQIITLANTGLSRQALQQQARKQQIKRLFRGAYIDAKEYAALDRAGQYRARAKAFLATHPKLSAWGITAAALEGAPVLSGAPLHFSGASSNAKTKQAGCVFHEVLPTVTEIGSSTAQILFECATTSPLPDALLAANYLLRRLTTSTRNNLAASRDIDEKTTEAFLREPLNSKSERVRAYEAFDVRKLDTYKAGFLERYAAARHTKLASPEAELAWLDFAQMCIAYGERRALRKALRAGLYFSDQAESPAETLLVARCVELGFVIPYLQVSILDPTSGQQLGRVDGLWPSAAVLRGLYQKDTRFGRLLYSKQLGDSSSIIIEFDGQLKYQQDYADVLEKERQRQNAIGNLGFRFVRISWDDLMQPDRLRSILLRAKVLRSRQN